MGFAWEAEQTIDEKCALKLVQEQFAELKAKTIKLLGTGWDNTAYLVNGIYVFRFPRRTIALDLLKHEAEILPKIADRLPLPIPIPQWQGTPSETYPWPFLGYRLLPGISACHASLTKEERIKTVPQLAAFFKTLHAIDLKALPGDLLNRTLASKLINAIRKQSEEAQSLLTRSFETDLSKSYREPLEKCLVHGDCYVRHLLVDEQHQLCGVIDWGDVHKGDPAVDLALIHSFIPQEGHVEFRRLYGSIDESTWELARLRAIYSMFCVLLYGHHSGDVIIKQEALFSLNEIL